MSKCIKIINARAKCAKVQFFSMLNMQICDPLIAIVIRLLKLPNLDFLDVVPYSIIAGVCPEFEAGRTLERTDIRGN